MTFDVLAMQPTADLFPLDSLQIELDAGTGAGDRSPGEIHFDDLNGGNAPKGAWCKPGSLTDDFEDGVEGVTWVRSWEDTGCSQNEQGGQLVIAPPNGATGYCSRVSSKSYDITGDVVVAEVTQILQRAERRVASAGTR